MLLVALVLAPVASAQDLTHEPQSWFGLFTNGPLTGRVVGWFDAHLRMGFGESPVTMTLLRPGVGFRVRDDMTVWVGYLWAPVWRDGLQTLSEHRVWQQWTWDLSFGSGAKMQLRSRLEQRFAAGEVGIRFRQFVRAQTAPLGGGPLMLAGWDELFLAFNDTRFGQLAGFDQNRLFLGVALKVSTKWRVEGGYFNQFLPRTGASPMRHAAAVNVFFIW